jgi:hypothetical protein
MKTASKYHEEKQKKYDRDHHHRLLARRHDHCFLQHHSYLGKSNDHCYLNLPEDMLEDNPLDRKYQGKTAVG